MKKYLFLPIILGAIFLTLTGCSSDQKITNFNEDGASKTASVKEIRADKVQVFTFYATQRCTTCIAIGKLSSEVVEEYYQPELRDGKIEVREINIDLPENKELAEKFQVGGSSLKINAIYDGQDHITEDTVVWRLTSSPTQFKTYLKNKIDTLLGK